MDDGILLNCSQCFSQFKKAKNEYSRRLRLGKDKFYCSRSCAAADSNKIKPRQVSQAFLNSKGGRHKDEQSPFRWFLRGAKRRKQRGITDLTLQYLLELWEQQKGICPLTSWQLILPTTSNGWSIENPFSPKSASLDRIDNTNGYVKGNIRYVAVIVNYARNIFNDAQVIEFACAVVKNVKG